MLLFNKKPNNELKRMQEETKRVDMTAKFTKGKWSVEKEDLYYHVTCGTHCVVTSFNGEDDEANAHLIAVAPIMYVELSDLRASLFGMLTCGVVDEKHSDYIEDKIKGIDSVLSKARGELKGNHEPIRT